MDLLCGLIVVDAAGWCSLCGWLCGRRVRGGLKLVHFAREASSVWPCCLPNFPQFGGRWKILEDRCWGKVQSSASASTFNRLQPADLSGVHPNETERAYYLLHEKLSRPLPWRAGADGQQGQARVKAGQGSDRRPAKPTTTTPNATKKRPPP